MEPSDLTPSNDEAPKKVRKVNSAPIPEEEYQRVKSDYPNIVWNDEDQSFITKAGHKQYARKMRFFKPMDLETIAEGRRVWQESRVTGWDKVVTYVENGLRLSDAAKRAGHTYSGLRKRIAMDPEYAKRIAEAEMKAAEPVEDSLFNAAINGNVPAAIKWLEKRSPERWPGDKTIIEAKNVYELDVSDRMKNIASLVARLQERAAIGAAPEAIDVEAVEPD